MTKREAQDYARLSERVLGMGVSREDFESLLRIERTLHRWAERECNGEVETEERPGRLAPLAIAVSRQRLGADLRYRIPNREAGALRRLAAIMARYPKLAAYHQTDPRGCALYVYEKDKLAGRFDCTGAKRDIDSCYSSVGVAMAF